MLVFFFQLSVLATSYNTISCLYLTSPLTAADLKSSHDERAKWNQWKCCSNTHFYKELVLAHIYVSICKLADSDNSSSKKTPASSIANDNLDPQPKMCSLWNFFSNKMLDESIWNFKFKCAIPVELSFPCFPHIH